MTALTNKQRQANKAKQVREALCLTPTECGVLLFGYSPKRAYDMWARWERDNKLSLPVERYFDLILFLDQARELKIPGASRAMSKYLAALRDAA